MKQGSRDGVEREDPFWAKKNRSVRKYDFWEKTLNWSKKVNMGIFGEKEPIICKIFQEGLLLKISLLCEKLVNLVYVSY